MRVNQEKVDFTSPSSIRHVLKTMPGVTTPEEYVAAMGFIEFSRLGDQDFNKEELLLFSGGIRNKAENLDVIISIKMVKGYVIASAENRDNKAKPAEEMIMKANPKLQLQKLNERDRQSVFRAFLNATEDVRDAWVTGYAEHRELAVKNLREYGVEEIREVKEVPIKSKKVEEYSIDLMIHAPWYITKSKRIDLSKKNVCQVGPGKVWIFECPPTIAA